ncbi:hypothetical protein K488DRAFT_72413 [Vararia minispora EC-137]|uniref:Uncharacterized protein n=1 Tax=Vararia minispora EC-137 TaxID=1314806 RepID=A0ACB8QEW8_9AGAM|nr:hypothetical protein K488DRAFT_72413 [Vararia minispora EC-137]
MAPKRKSTGEGIGAAKKVKTMGPRLKKAVQPNWLAHKDWSLERPTGEWVNKAIERWSLLAPYDTSITEEYWMKYYNERMALDAVNSPNEAASLPIISEELGQDTFELLRAASRSVADVVYGCALADIERRTAIARTLRGSLYYLDLWGNDEEGAGDNPRTVNARTRLYSPFGTGASMDFVYDYHYRTRFYMADERFSTLYARARSIKEVDSEKPLMNTAVHPHERKRYEPAGDAVRIHNMVGSRVSGTTQKNLEGLAEDFFGVVGWLSPLKLFTLFSAAGTVDHYQERLTEDILEKAGLNKFKPFTEETDGRVQGDEEAKALTAAEQESDPSFSVPQRLLLLAKQGMLPTVPSNTQAPRSCISADIAGVDHALAAPGSISGAASIEDAPVTPAVVATAEDAVVNVRISPDVPAIEAAIEESPAEPATVAPGAQPSTTGVGEPSDRSLI